EDEWQALEASEPEEQRFCEAVASLGLDPYSLTDADRDVIVQVSERLPPELVQDFFASADIQLLTTQMNRLIDGVNHIKSLQRDLTSLKELQQTTQKIDALHTPWEQGYACARALRRQLGIEDRLIRDIHDFSACLQVDDQALQDVILPTNGPIRFF